MDRVAIKKRAKEFAFQNKWNIWKPLLIFMIISFVISFVISFIITLLKVPETVRLIIILVLGLALLPMSVGLASYILKLVNGKEADLINELLSRYKDGSAFPIIKTMFLASLFVCLWSLLFVIPGIICGIAYAMMGFILAEQTADEVNAKPAYKLSKEKMNGHKWEYFVFQLSFILWILGTSFTFGILGIWSVPYITTANVMWYEELKKISK